MSPFIYLLVEHGRFSGIRQVAPVCTPPNTCFLGPTGVHNPNGILISSAIFAQLMAECIVRHARACPFLYESPIGFG